MGLYEDNMNVQERKKKKDKDFTMWTGFVIFHSAIPARM